VVFVVSLTGLYDDVVSKAGYDRWVDFEPDAALLGIEERIWVEKGW
jgi:hypothetical protein